MKKGLKAIGIALIPSLALALMLFVTLGCEKKETIISGAPAPQVPVFNAVGTWTGTYTFRDYKTNSNVTVVGVLTVTEHSNPQSAKENNQIIGTFSADGKVSPLVNSTGWPGFMRVQAIGSGQDFVNVYFTGRVEDLAQKRMTMENVTHQENARFGDHGSGTLTRP